ncbi:MAG TPA: hypothetical protein VE053_06370 [Allosphingosinicella sp.]|nr:hypothetical protein [Allosphingosinicella sp.]
MSICQEVGEWIEENVIQPVEQFFEQLQEVCNDVREWVEREVLEPVQKWQDQLQKVCEEQACNWFCACCNKWLCWMAWVAVLVTEWVVRIVGEWLVKVICDLITVIVRTIVMMLIQLLKWIILFVICFVEALCPILLLMGALALLTLLLSIAAQGAPQIAAAAAPNIPIAVSVLLITFPMVRFLCRMDWCRIVNAVGWAFKWAIVLGAAMAIFYLAPVTGWYVALFGGMLSALIVALEPGTCRLKSMLALP